MSKEKRIECPFCSELIFPDAKKCRFCKEWLKKPEGEVIKNPLAEKGVVVAEEVVQSSPVEEDSSEADKVPVHEGGGFRWWLALRVSLAFFYVALVFVGVFYEVSAKEVLDFALKLEKDEKYDVAYLSYQTVAKKYPLSFAASDAIAGLSRTDGDFLDLGLSEFGVTFLEDVSGGRFDSYVHYGLPLAASMVCFAVCILVVLVRIFQIGSAIYPFLLVVFSGLFFLVQVTAYGWDGSSGPFFDMSMRIMKSHEGVYVAGYALLLMTAIVTLCGKKK